MMNRMRKANKISAGGLLELSLSSASAFDSIPMHACNTYLHFLLAHDAPLANGVTIFGQNVAGLWVRGVVACSTTGNLPGRGLAGVNVTIVCNGARTEPLAQILTDGNGVFNAILTALEGIAFDQSPAPCEAIVHTPIVGCELLGRPGLLRAVVNVAANLVQTMLGLVATTVLGPFQFVPI